MHPISYAIIIICVLLLLATACEERPAVHNTATIPVAAGSAVNINTATVEELKALPYIGDKVAAKIIEHREINGPFRRPEHLMLIPGISDERFRKIRPLVRVE